MSANKQALREAAEKANELNPAIGLKEFARRTVDYHALANPAIVMALLDELEATERRNGELSASLKDLIGVVNTVNRSRHHEIKMDDDDEPCYWQRKEWIEYLMETVTSAESVYRAAGISVKGE